MARITRQKTKHVFIPDDADKASVELRLLKDGEEENLNLIGVNVGGNVPDNGEEEVKTTFTINDEGIVARKIQWMVAVFYSWKNFYTLDNEQAPCDKPHIIAFNNEMVIIDEDGEKKTLHAWAQDEYEKFKKEEEAATREAAKN